MFVILVYGGFAIMFQTRAKLAKIFNTSKFLLCYATKPLLFALDALARQSPAKSVLHWARRGVYW